MKTFAYTTLLVGFLALSSALGGSWGCSGGGGGGGGGTGTTNLQGTIALNDGSVGTLNVTINTAVASKASFSLIREANAQTSGTVSATCTCTSPTCTVNNGTGTYNTSTGALNISGTGTGSTCNGTTTTFTGAVSTTGSGGSGGGMSGTISTTPPSGGTSTNIGGFSGVFTTNNSGGAKFYCGLAEGGSAQGGGEDTLTVTVATDGSLSGTAQPLNNSNDKGAIFSGKVTSSNSTGSTFTACSDDPTNPSPICGEIGNDGTFIGKFQRKEGGEGCFSGSISVCSTGTLPTPCTGPTANCTYPTCP